MKAPSDRISFNLASFLYIRLANSRKKTQNIEKTLKTSGNELEDIKITTLKQEDIQVENEIKVMIIGKLENPKLVCMRELRHHESDCDMISIGVKKDIAQ